MLSREMRLRYMTVFARDYCDSKNTVSAVAAVAEAVQRDLMDDLQGCMEDVAWDGSPDDVCDGEGVHHPSFVVGLDQIRKFAKNIRSGKPINDDTPWFDWLEGNDDATCPLPFLPTEDTDGN